jgi:hypothetical protein
LSMLLVGVLHERRKNFSGGGVVESIRW